MLAVGDVNGHLAGEADQLAVPESGTTVMDCCGDPRQSAAVLEHEAAGATWSDPVMRSMAT